MSIDAATLAIALSVVVHSISATPAVSVASPAGGFGLGVRPLRHRLGPVAAIYVTWTVSIGNRIRG